MKKFKSFVYMLALALIFVGAASVTKASAEDTGYTVTLSKSGEVATIAGSYTVDEVATTINENEASAVAAGSVVTVTYTLSANAGDVTVAVTPETLGETHDENNRTVTFTMGEANVTIAISAATKTTEDGGQTTPTPEETPTVTPTPEENPTTTPTPEAAAKLTKDDVDVDYDDEIIVVESNAQVYYQIVKTAGTNSGLKTANWIKAAEASDGEYWIDFSATANSKDVFFALTTDSTKDAADYVETVEAAVKSLKATLNYKTEEFDGGLADVISKLDVKGVDADYTTKEGLVAIDEEQAKTILTTEATKTAKVFSLQWKRGANDYWHGASEFEPVDWNMLKASNGTLYIAADGLYKLAEGEAEVVEFRMSKEAKVKIPKSAKAPTIKVDYVKGTLAVKNGMQIRLDNSGIWTKWMDVIAYKKGGTDNGIFALAEKNLETSVKASKVTVADFVAAINDEAILNFGAEDGAKIKLEVRTAATVKKFPSMAGIMELVLPAAAPTVAEGEKTLTYTEKVEKTPAEFKVKFSELFTKAADKAYTDYEYILVGDKTKGVNLEKQKWTKLTGDEVDWSKNVGKSYTYYEKGSTEKKTVEYTKVDAIYIRLAAKKAASKTEVGVFASNYAVIDVKVEEKKAETTPTTTPTPGEEPTTTPTPGEEPTGTPAATEYTITCETTGAAFKVADATVVKAAKEAEVTIVYTPEEGKEVTAIVVTPETGDVINVDVSGDWKFTMPEANVTVAITVGNVTPDDPDTT